MEIVIWTMNTWTLILTLPHPTKLRFVNTGAMLI
jgi:hypothetical protein